MAVYASADDASQVLGEGTLLGIASSDTGIDTDKVVAALAEASSLADTYLTDYLPNLTAPYPPILRRAVVWIGNELMRTSEQSTEDSRRGYDRALAWLKDVAAGKAVIPGVQPPDEVAQPGDPVFASEERVWSRGSALRLL